MKTVLMHRLALVMARATRTARGLWPDRNPLRRRADRAEAAIAGGLIVAFLAGAPLAVVTARHAAYRGASHVAAAGRSWRRVPAVLLAAAPPPGSGKYQAAVPARWAAPDGALRTGAVPAPLGARAGTTQQVWSMRPAG